MIRISVCVETVFKELPIAERIAKVKALGADAFEFWVWNNKDLEELERTQEELRFPLAAMVGAKTPLTDPAAHGQVLEDIERSLEVAKKLKSRSLIVTSGAEQPDASRQDQHDSIVQVLKKAAPLMERAGVTLVLEPLNVAVNHKGTYLYSSHEGFDILRSVNSPRVKMLYDIYHQQITEGNIIATIRDNIDWIGHFHLADVPGRHEPGTGELNYQNIFTAIGQTGYQEYVGCEFIPQGDPEQALGNVVEMAKNA